MTDIISLRKNEPITNTYIMSEKLDVQHKTLIRTVEDVRKHGTLESHVFSQKYYESTFTNKMGRTFKMYELNKSAFMKVIMQLGKYKKAHVLQDEFIEGLQQMERALLNQQNSDWTLTRELGKETRLAMTDTTKEFIEYAKKQGASRGANYYYSNLTKATYKGLKLIEHEKPKTREFLDRMELFHLVVAENAIKNVMMEEMEKGTHFQEIYLLCKQKIEAIAETVLFTPPKKQIKENHGK